MLVEITEDVKSVKRIVEDFKRHGWIKNLHRGFRFIQDVEPRSGAVFLVAERFLKSAADIRS